MSAILGASITYRLAFGPNAGRKALTLQTVPVKNDQRKGDDLVTQQAGFSLHASLEQLPRFNLKVITQSTDDFRVRVVTRYV